MPKPGKGKKKTKNMADNSPSAGKTKAKTGKTNNRVKIFYKNMYSIMCITPQRRIQYITYLQ